MSSTGFSIPFPKSLKHLSYTLSRSSRAHSYKRIICHEKDENWIRFKNSQICGVKLHMIFIFKLQNRWIFFLIIAASKSCKSRKYCFICTYTAPVFFFLCMRNGLKTKIIFEITFVRNVPNLTQYHCTNSKNIKCFLNFWKTVIGMREKCFLNFGNDCQ